MRINQNTELRGKKVTLVPYSPAHVARRSCRIGGRGWIPKENTRFLFYIKKRYHEWMQSEELQRLTASEPLSLEQEYEMQRSWRDDADSNESLPIKALQKYSKQQNTKAGKDLSLERLSQLPLKALLKAAAGLTECTFIVLDTERWSNQAHGDEECMVGDVNLFLTDTEDPTLGEIEIMIAEPSYRGRGFGKEATLMMMSYGVTDLGITKFEAKIGQENEASICMFKKLHFKEVSVNSVFQEVTLRLDVSDQERQWLLEQTKHVKKKSYVEEKLPAGVLETDR